MREVGGRLNCSLLVGFVCVLGRGAKEEDLAGVKRARVGVECAGLVGFVCVWGGEAEACTPDQL